MPVPSAFATRLASVAEDQHAKFQFTNEADPALCSQIQKWTEDLGFEFTSCTTVPWSAVFVSWCVMQAGATKAEFKFWGIHFTQVTPISCGFESGPPEASPRSTCKCLAPQPLPAGRVGKTACPGCANSDG